MTPDGGLVLNERRARRRIPQLRVVLAWLMPGAGVLLVTGVLLLLGSAELVLEVTGRYRWVVYGLGFAFAGGFHRSRLFVVVLGHGALDLVTSGVPETDVLSALGTVLLVLIGALSLMRDRGVASTAGIGQIVASTVLAAVPAMVFYDSVNVEAFLSMELIPGWTTRWTGLPQSVAFFSLVSFAATGYGIYRWRGAVERSLMWCQFTLLLAIHPATSWAADSLLLMAAGMTLAIFSRAFEAIEPLQRRAAMDTTRILLIAGKRDRITPASEAIRLHRHFEGSKYQTYPGAHLFQVGRGKAFRHMGRFLGGLGLLPPR